MQEQEAMQHALGYAAGREDSGGPKTAEPAGQPGFMAFAEAYAAGWARFNREAWYMMPSARSAYDSWQATGGATIYGELQRMPTAGLRRLADSGEQAAARELAARERDQQAADRIGAELFPGLTF